MIEIDAVHLCRIIMHMEHCIAKEGMHVARHTLSSRYSLVAKQISVELFNGLVTKVPLTELP